MNITKRPWGDLTRGFIGLRQRLGGLFLWLWGGRGSWCVRSVVLSNWLLRLDELMMIEWRLLICVLSLNKFEMSLIFITKILQIFFLITWKQRKKVTILVAIQCWKLPRMHQIAPRFQKFSGGDSPGPPSVLGPAGLGARRWRAINS